MKIIECPRDAMQGLPGFILTEQKIAYINQLLKVGFDTIDFGSFVSPKAIPQMRDTQMVLQGLELENTKSKLLAIIANLRGAKTAVQLEGIDYLGFPLSLSETFQQRNTNRSIDEALATLQEIQNLCLGNDLVLVTYLSMGFGNPYGDPYEPAVVIEFVERLANMEVKIISLADTIGVSDKANITTLFQELIPAYPGIEFGAHLHSSPDNATEKITAAFAAGCRRFDSALKGYGGCPMAEDSLVGNIATESLISCLKGLGVEPHLDTNALNQAMLMVPGIFSNTH